MQQALWGIALKKIHTQPGATALPGEVAPFANFSASFEAQLRLFETYPLFFRAARFPETYLSNLGYWGLQCGPGWFPAIENAAAIVESELKKLLLRISENRTLVSVDRILNDACETHRYDRAEGDDATAGLASLIPFCSEVCEADGALRISLVNGYLCDGATWMTIRSAVDRAVLQASRLCERCGRSGQYRAGYWCRVYCEVCAATTRRC